MSKVGELSALRALAVFDHSPSGCMLFPVADQWSEPHIKWENSRFAIRTIGSLSTARFF
jgi:hypothetical protein